MSELNGNDVMPGFDDERALRELHARMEAEEEQMDDATAAGILAELNKDPEWRNYAAPKPPKNYRKLIVTPVRYAAAVLVTVLITSQAIRFMRDGKDTNYTVATVRDTIRVMVPQPVTPIAKNSGKIVSSPASATPPVLTAAVHEKPQPRQIIPEQAIDTTVLVASQKPDMQPAPVQNTVLVAAVAHHAPARAMHYNDIKNGARHPGPSSAAPAFAKENGLMQGIMAHSKPVTKRSSY